MRSRFVLVCTVLLLADAAVSHAQSSAQQAIAIEIRPISRLAVSGATSFTLSKGRPAGIVKSTASYAITTNEDNRAITVALDAPLPDGVTLRMRMMPPSGVAPADPITVSTAPQVAVSGISRLNAKDLGIEFELVTGDRAVMADAVTTRTVRVTLVSGP
jgi:hypothetical protein